MGWQGASVAGVSGGGGERGRPPGHSEHLRPVLWEVTWGLKAGSEGLRTTLWGRHYLRDLPATPRSPLADQKPGLEQEEALGLCLTQLQGCCCIEHGEGDIESKGSLLLSI